jgi:uncharacterized Zn-finger protein
MTVKHPEIFKVPEAVHQVSCDGGGGAMGHPKVYYSFDGGEEVVCGYCDRLFTKKEGTGAKPLKGAA